MATVEVMAEITLQGGRETMEDVYSMSSHSSGWRGYLVADGHGGDAVALHLRNQLLPCLLNKLSTIKSDEEKKIGACIEDAYVELDMNLAGRTANSGLERKATPYDTVGSTAVVALLSPDFHLWIVQLGDSGATVLQQATNEAESKIGSWYTVGTTVTHDLAQPEEKIRILNAGGGIVDTTPWYEIPHKCHLRISDHVTHTCVFAPNLGRAFGDFLMKKKIKRKAGKIILDVVDHTEGIMTVVPSITHYQLSPTKRYAILMGSDGFWDYVPKHIFEPQILGLLSLASADARLTTFQTKLIHSLLPYKLDNLTVLLLRISLPHPLPT